ncbi:SAF domain-containing protein [Nocardia bovistercoris]|uniref:Flagellar biosynthesis protein FlgA n=1 Tax=Nocardia bovistercoris TaxID=2785916 RepID=A0A931MZH6_9NOCA|nr:SAF domain-containing protein [Nocardia bovistercoris]MBH0776150.1 flagellar biosynthesis protein FlgA [Nocardia bovistercoris]
MIRSRTDLGRGNTLRAAFWNRPPWADQLLARRLLAAALIVAAIVLSLRGDPGARRAQVVVAGRDLAPGTSLSAEDLRLAAHESGGLPEGVLREQAPLLGATLTGAMRTGEVFTDLRIVGPRLAAVAGGARDARIVPLRLADTAVADILRAGDRVDVISAEETTGPAVRPARTLATDAAVVLVSEPGERRAADRVVLVAMDSDHATAVAAASLRTALTVVFH